MLTGTAVTGIIDFDFAHPGPRLWDVAYAVYRWVPITRAGMHEGQAERLRFFADRYGLGPVERAALPATVAARLTAMVTMMRGEAAQGHEAFTRHMAEGHDRLYEADAAHAAAFDGHPALSCRCPDAVERDAEL